MAFCKKCGTQFEAEGAFCGNCGTPVAAGATSGMKSPGIDHELPLTVHPSPKAPKVYKSYWYLTVPIILLLLLAWHNRSSIAGHITALTGSPLDSEAKTEATKVFDAEVSKCGDKYYTWGGVLGHHRDIVIEMTEKPRFATAENMKPVNTPVSDVDRMNGLTWSGSWAFEYSVSRHLDPHEIGPWQDGGAFGIGIKRLNGVWLVQQDFSMVTMT